MMKYLIAIAVCISVIILVWACRNKHGDQGSIQQDSSVDQDFMEGKIKPNLRYYYLGSENAPYVILGVEREIILDNARDWLVMDLKGAKNLKDIVQSMYDRWRQQGYSLAGFRVLDQKGRYLGDWYSIWDTKIINPFVFSKDYQHTEIYPPPFPRLEP